MDRETALDDFLQRIGHYKNIYQTMEEEHEGDLSFMKIVNAGEKLIVNRHEGNLQSRIVYWLMNIHITPRCAETCLESKLTLLRRTIYLTRHGESMHNVVGK